MTYEAAHNYVEDMQRVLRAYPQIFTPEMTNANCLALEALEKQIPKKPIKYEYMGEEYDETKTHCPRCNGVLLFGISSPYDVYCHHCGQRLDWSEIYRKENEK